MKREFGNKTRAKQQQQQQGAKLYGKVENFHNASNKQQTL